jgi:hypothetical protein
MAVVVAAHLELDPVDLAGELAALYVALGSDGGPGFAADVESLVSREDERLGPLDATLAYLLAVVVERHVATLGQSAAVVGELGAHLVLARRHGLVGLRREGLDTEQVVGEPQLAVLRVEAPAADRTTLGDNRPGSGGYVRLETTRCAFPGRCSTKKVTDSRSCADRCFPLR